MVGFLGYDWDNAGVAMVALPQLGLFQTVSAVEERLRERLLEVDVDRTTPLDALQLLQDLKSEAKG